MAGRAKRRDGEPAVPEAARPAYEAIVGLTGRFCQVNGFVVDARRLQREVQEEAYRKGLIPYVPAEKPVAGETTAE
jgi:hypothetical protein